MVGGILFRDKHLKILLALRDTTQSWYISTLAKASNTTYVHTCNFLKVCEGLGITDSEKHGKIKLVKLTETGVKLADMLASAYSMVNSVENERAVQQKQQQEPAK